MSTLDVTISLDDAVADLRDRVAGVVPTERDPNYAEACVACATKRCVWPSGSDRWWAAWLLLSAADRGHVG